MQDTKDLTYDSDTQDAQTISPQQSLINWVMSRVRSWQDVRDREFKQDWEKYYLMWRCRFDNKLRSRVEERSKIVSPALMQAIDDNIAEIEDSLFSTDSLMDLIDNYGDQDTTDIMKLRELLREDMENQNVEDALKEIITSMVIYGTGIGKVVLEEQKYYEMQVTNNIPQTVQDSKFVVKVIPIHPEEFVIDPAARSIDDALGMAHVTIVPKHSVETKMREGVYTSMDIGGMSQGYPTPELYKQPQEGDNPVNYEDQTKIIEYHGLVPKKLLYNAQFDTDVTEISDLLAEGESERLADVFDEGPEKMVEAIITIANDQYLLRAVENEFMMRDRCFIAAVYEKIPNRFWGRGIGEKGINVARAIDAELRARIDSMALSLSPMLGINAAALPPGAPIPKVAPGESLLFNGDPSVALKEIRLSSVGPESFNQTSELRQMLQQATGTLDMTRPEGYAGEKTGVINAALMQPAKRASRVVHNVENMLIKPLVYKLAWRYIQFDPMRYPATDVTFRVKTRRSALSRQMQAQEYSNLLSTVPQDSPAYYILLKGIFENSSIPDREQVIAIIEQMMQMQLQAQMQQQQADPVIMAQLEKIAAEIEAIKTDNNLKLAKFQVETALKEEDLAIKREKIVLDSKLEAANIEQDAMTTQAQLAMQADEMQFNRLKELQAMVEQTAKKLEQQSNVVSKKIRIIEDDMGNPIGGEVQEYDSEGNLVGTKKIDLTDLEK